MGDARVRAWLAVAAWTGVILLFSSDAFSASETSRFLGPLLRALLPGLDEAGLAAAHDAVRKGAHVAEYAVLALLALRALRSGRPTAPPVAAVAPSLAWVLLVAVVDEGHQALTSARTGSAADIALDVAGGGLALMAAVAYLGSRSST